MMNELTRQLFRQIKRHNQAMKKTKENRNGNGLPHAKDFKLPKRLTKDQRELIEATREAMKALKEEEVKIWQKNLSVTHRSSPIIATTLTVSFYQFFFRQLCFLNWSLRQLMKRLCRNTSVGSCCLTKINV